MLASFAAYAVASTMVFSFGVTLAPLEVSGSTCSCARPPSRAASTFARAISALGFGLLSLAALYVVAIGVGGIRVAPEVWLEMTVWMLVGAVPFIFFGFFTPTPQALPRRRRWPTWCFRHGLRLWALRPARPASPASWRRSRPTCPRYHYAQLAWASIGAPSQPVLTSLAWLGGYAVAFFALSMWAYRRDARRRFG